MRLGVDAGILAEDAMRHFWKITSRVFVFLPKLIQRGMQADAKVVVDAFGKNEQVMKVIWALFIAIAGLVITKVLDPGMAQQVVGVLTTGGL